MKNTIKVQLVRVFGIIALTAVIGLGMAACGGGGGDSKEISDLSGDITISPSENVYIGLTKELVATYTGPETVSYEWKSGEGKTVYSMADTLQLYNRNGGDYTVTVSAEGYNSKTSAPVTVTKLNAPLFKAVTDSTFGTSDILAIASNGRGVIVIVGDGGKMARSEDDGITWTAVDVSSIFGTGKINAITYNSALYDFIAVGNGGKMARSMDYGITWTAVDVSHIFGTNDILAIASSGTRFVAGGKGGKMAACVYNGTWLWTEIVAHPFSNSDWINAIAYGSSKFVAVGTDGKIAYSQSAMDINTWTAATGSPFGSSAIYAISYGKDKFIAVGYGGKMELSSDGTAWEAITDSKFSSSQNIKAITYASDNSNCYVAGGFDGQISFSFDGGTTWTAAEESAFGTRFVEDVINGITYVNGKYIIVGGGGKIVWSPIFYKQ